MKFTKNIKLNIMEKQYPNIEVKHMVRPNLEMGENSLRSVQLIQLITFNLVVAGSWSCSVLCSFLLLLTSMFGCCCCCCMYCESFFFLSFYFFQSIFPLHTLNRFHLVSTNIYKSALFLLSLAMVYSTLKLFLKPSALVHKILMMWLENGSQRLKVIPINGERSKKWTYTILFHILCKLHTDTPPNKL